MPLQMSGPSNLSKAFITKIVDDVIKSTYVFNMNFGELNSANEAEYNFISPPGSMFPTAIYRASNSSEITFSLLIDLGQCQSNSFYMTWDDKFGAVDNLGIEAHLAFFESLTLPEVDTFLASRSRWTAPPRLIFGFGERTWNVVCTKASRREVLYTRTMAPYRATVDVSLQPIFTNESDMLSYMRRVQYMCSGVESQR
jgi:hypothetical protein